MATNEQIEAARAALATAGVQPQRAKSKPAGEEVTRIDAVAALYAAGVHEFDERRVESMSAFLAQRENEQTDRIEAQHKRITDLEKALQEMEQELKAMSLSPYCKRSDY